jgi:hypothetical protein
MQHDRPVPPRAIIMLRGARAIKSAVPSSEDADGLKAAPLLLHFAT